MRLVHQAARCHEHTDTDLPARSASLSKGGMDRSVRKCHGTIVMRKACLRTVPRHSPKDSFGFTLIELLIALPLAALVASCAALLLLRQGQLIRNMEARSTGARELRHARLILETDLSPLGSDDIAVASDSLIELRSQVGVGILCTLYDTSALVLSPIDSTGVWPRTVRRGDEVMLWKWLPVPGKAPQPIVVTVKGNPLALGPGRCGTLPVQNRWKVEISALPSGTRAAGSAVRVVRWVRYGHYRSGNQWWLGRRTRDFSGWDVVQPVAGPLVSASRGGMKVNVIRYSDPDASSTPRDSVIGMQIELLAPRAMAMLQGSSVDTMRFDVTLRGALGAGRP